MYCNCLISSLRYIAWGYKTLCTLSTYKICLQIAVAVRQLVITRQVWTKLWLAATSNSWWWNCFQENLNTLWVAMTWALRNRWIRINVTGCILQLFISKAIEPNRSVVFADWVGKDYSFMPPLCLWRRFELVKEIWEPLCRWSLFAVEHLERRLPHFG
jgi:hypothetical protein